MPGKHAPASPKSFTLSVARAIAGAAAVLALVGLIALAAVRSNDGEPAAAERTPSATASASPTVRRTPTTPPPTTTATAQPLRKRSKISVLVLNATNRAGIAARVRQRLLAEGYQDVEVGNTVDRARSVVYYRKGYRPEGSRLLKDLDGVDRTRSAPPDLTGDAKLTVILGADFKE